MTAPASFLTEELRQLAIGQESPSVTAEVEKGAIIKFAQAIGDDNPVFNGIIAPPTFLRSVPVSRAEFPFETPYDRTLDGGSEWEYFEPVRPGDQITGVSRIEDVNERTGRMGLMIIATYVFTYQNQFGQVVATQTNTTITY